MFCGSINGKCQMNNILKFQILLLLLVSAGCLTRHRHAEFEDEHIRIYNCVFGHSLPGGVANLINNNSSIFGQPLPEGVTILHSYMFKVARSSIFHAPREPSPKEWDSAEIYWWAFEMKAPADYVELLKTTFKLELASERAELFKQSSGPSWCPMTTTDYVIYNYGNFYVDVTPYWEMLIFPETEKQEIVHFYLRLF